MPSFFSILLIVIVAAVVFGGRAASKPASRKQGGYRKWIGGGLGWAFGGPLGALLGFAFGNMFDDMGGGKYETQPTLLGDFNISLLVLSAAMMKADGTVKKSELEYVKKFLKQNFGQEAAEDYVLMLRKILKQPINLQEVGQQIGRFMDASSKLQLMYYLFGIALSDGDINDVEINILQQISAYIGMAYSDFESIKARFVKEKDSAYKILEISPDASDEELKKAYRDMAMKFHPDKVAHLGDEVRKAAEEKFKDVQKAYDLIKKQRGIN